MLTYYMIKEVRIYNGVKTVSSINDIEKIGYMQKRKEIGPPSYTIYKNRLKTD